MSLVVLVLIVLAMASPSHSDTVRVRTIELGDVTRVAVEFSERLEWTQSTTPKGISIGVPPGSVGDLDWTSMFAGQEKSRLEDVTVSDDGSEVILRLSCACDAQISEFGDVSLVVDIADAEADTDHDLSERKIFLPEIVSWSGPTPGVGPAIEATSRSDPDLSARYTLPLVSPPVPTARPSEPADTYSAPVSSRRTSSRLPFPMDTFSEFQSTGFATQTLARELARAIAQGLVDAPDPDAIDSPTFGGQVAGVDLGDDRTNIQVTTAVDRDTSSAGHAQSTTRVGSVCLPDSVFDINAWGDTKDRTVLGALRSAAFDKNGQADQAGVLALSRYYLALGFGAEAKSISKQITDAETREIIETLADIVDHRGSANPALEGQIVCKGKVALWAMLARPVDQSERPTNTEHILAAFSELPLHIRVHLGPVLSERLQDFEFLSEAQIALNAVTRAGSQTRAQDLTAARLGLSGTSADSARTELKRLSRGTDLIAAEALLELLLDAERRLVPPAPDWVGDAPSLVRAVQGTDTAEDLNLAAIRGRVALGQFDVLRVVLGNDSPGATAPVRAELAALALAAAAVNADDATLLRSELSFSKIADLPAIPSGNRLDLAARLIGLGLARRALVYLPEFPSSDRERKLKAEALSDLLRFDEAIVILSEPPSQNLMHDLGQTLLRDGQVAEAVRAFAKAAKPEAASRAALQGADWTWLQRNADESLRDASRILTQERAAPLLPSNVDILQGASQTRDQAKALLERTKIVQDDPAFTN